MSKAINHTPRRKARIENPSSERKRGRKRHSAVTKIKGQIRGITASTPESAIQEIASRIEALGKKRVQTRLFKLLENRLFIGYFL
jgi:hypothetical protein